MQKSWKKKTGPTERSPLLAKTTKKTQKAGNKKTDLAVAQSPTGEKKYFNYLKYLK